MPYNTRRKSLSLPSLGIHIPVTHAARDAARAAANRAAANTASASPTTTSRTMSSTTATSMAPPSREDRHATKRLKRTHSESEGSEQELPSAPLAKRRSAAAKFDHTPPPSPPPTDRSSVEMGDADDDDDDPSSIKKVDLEGINDEIVEAVIVQLQDTGNRPHLVKELAAVLMQHLKIVQQ